MTRARLQRLLERFARRRILVVGDVMLDEFLWGKVSRISPEAPVPVVEVTRESYFPGGAANVARNLRALNAQTILLGVVGRDQDGERLRELLGHQGVDIADLLADPARPTTVKTRIVAHHQQVVRFDRERTERIAAALERRLLERFRARLRDADAVIFEDYGKGLLTQHALGVMQREVRRQGRISAADPSPHHPLRYLGLTAITPNRAEAFAAAHVAHTEPLDNPLQDQPLLAVGSKLLRKWKAGNLLITLGEHGMCLFRPGRRPIHIPTVAREVFDVSGAGDTVIATLALALAAGANAVEAAQLANHAAGVVVGKLGTATCSVEELARSFRRNLR
jgi:rfaE bifunctional protein kinase chain/domain